VLAPSRRPQRVRLDAGPGRGQLPARAHRRHGPGRAALPAGHAGAGDDLAGPRRLGRDPRRDVRRPLVPPPAPLRHAPPAADRLRGRAHPAPHGEVHHRQRRAEPGLRAGVRLRPRRGQLGVLRLGLRGGGRPRRRGRRPAAAGHRPPGRLRGPRRPRPDHPGRGRPGVRRHLLAALAVVGLGGVLGRAGAAGQRRGGVRADGADGRVLAGLDQPGGVPRASLAELPAA
jgi:translation initiation factor IF-2